MIVAGFVVKYGVTRPPKMHPIAANTSCHAHFGSKTFDECIMTIDSLHDTRAHTMEPIARTVSVVSTNDL